ncbi:hypothetical protein [Chrysiogenes arsenatis]|uniref:hypothetical protein n=1 Tax=Chrysiogenes arsenatis TaxID=309797 RepID=UPI000428581F|nr:hypothetical protein [Chrysiogenes arsenatis]
MNIDVKKILIFMYIIVPTIFYLIPLIVYFVFGEFCVFFSSKYCTNFNELISLLIGHFLLGTLVVLTLKKSKYDLKFKKESLHLNFLALIILVGVSISSGIVQALLFSLFFVVMANISISKMFALLLLIVSFLVLILFEQRTLLVLVSIIVFIKFIASRTYFQLFLLVLFAIFMLVYVLQPLRYGQIPFSEYQNVTMALGYLYQHLSPVYYTAYLANSIDFSTVKLLVEFIPLGKSIFGEPGAAEFISQQGLAGSFLDEGLRLGSNSSMYFSIIGIPILLFIVSIIKFEIEFLKSKILTNSILLYLVVQGSFFIRRSFASYMIDILLITFWVVIISIIIQTIKKRKQRYDI